MGGCGQGGADVGRHVKPCIFLFIAQASLLARTANKEPPGNHFDGFILSVASFKAFKDTKWVLNMCQYRLPSKIGQVFCPEGR